MKVNRDNFHFWIGLVDKILPSTKLVLPIHRAIRLESDGLGTLILESNSDFHALKVQPIDCDGIPFGPVAVEARDLFHATVGEEEFVEIEYDEGAGHIVVQNGSDRYDLLIRDVSTFVFPDLPTEECGTIEKGKLVDILNTTLPFLGTDNAQPHLLGVYFKGGSIYSSDSTHGARFKLVQMVFPDDLNFIPDAVLEVLSSGGDKDTPVKMLSSEQWVGFEAGPLLLLTRRWATKGQYQPSAIDEAIELGKGGKADLSIDCGSLKQALDRVNYFVDMGMVKLIVSRKGVRIEAFSDNRTVAKIPLVATSNLVTETEYIVEVNHLDALLKVGKDKLNLKISGSTDFIYFGAEGMDYYSSPAVL